MADLEGMERALEIVRPPILDVPEPEPEDRRLWSVTTIIGALEKRQLQGWAAREAAEAALNAMPTLRRRIEAEGREAVVDWISAARFRPKKGKKKATDLGSAVHKACELYAITGERPSVDDDVLPFVIQFEKFCQLYQPEYVAAEVTVYSPRYGVAGTCDGFLNIDGVRFIADYKTTGRARDSKGNDTTPFPEVALQLAAYRYAEFAAAWRPRRYEHYRRRYYLLGPRELEAAVALPEVDAGLCIHITPEHCHPHLVDCGPEIYRAFLHVLEAARFSFQTANRVIGDVLTPPI